MIRTAARFVFFAACLAPAHAQGRDQKDATAAFVRGLQTAGGFLLAPSSGPARRDQPSLRATSAALRALRYFGGKPKDADAAARFVADCFDKTSGGFADQASRRGRPDVYSTAVGIMAVVELKMPAEDYTPCVVKYLGENAKTFEEIRIAAAGLEAVHKRPPQADAWLEEIAKMRNADGTYGKGDGAARDTGGAVVTVLRLGGKVEHRDAVLATLKAGQRPDGGFGKAGEPTSDLETTYRVMRAFVMLKARPDAERLRRFVTACRNADGGYGAAPGQRSNVAATYFAGIILHWLAEK